MKDKTVVQKLPIPKSITHLQPTSTVKEAIDKIKEDLQDVPSECSNVNIEHYSYQKNTLSELSSSLTFAPKASCCSSSNPPIKLQRRSSYLNVYSAIEPILYSGTLFVEQSHNEFIEIIATLDSKMLIIDGTKGIHKYPLEYYYASSERYSKLGNNDKYYLLTLSSFHLETVYLFTKSKEDHERWFSLINKATSRIILEHKYIRGDVIGSGSYGIVYLAKNKFTRQIVAIKVIRKKDLEHEAQLKKEIDILKICKHPNIVKLIEVIDSSHSIALVMEYLSGGSLESYGKTFFETARIRDILNSLTSALFYLKELGIMHRDIKRGNIMFISNSISISDIKIVDFGLTSICHPEEQLKGLVGTASYVSPEVILNEKYNFKTDIWSLGVVFYSLLCGKLPFTKNDIFNSIVTNEPNYDAILTERGPAALDLVKKMLKKDPFERISIEKIRDHPFLQKAYSKIRVASDL